MNEFENVEILRETEKFSIFESSVKNEIFRNFLTTNCLFRAKIVIDILVVNKQIWKCRRIPLRNRKNFNFWKFCKKNEIFRNVLTTNCLFRAKIVIDILVVNEQIWKFCRNWSEEQENF